MALHTLGYERGDNRHDVKEMARAMAGWTVGVTPANFDTFDYRLANHDNGPKQILGPRAQERGAIGKVRRRAR